MCVCTCGYMYMYMYTYTCKPWKGISTPILSQKRMLRPPCHLLRQHSWVIPGVTHSRGSHIHSQADCPYIREFI